MIVGTTLYKMDGTAFYTPEFGRGGLAATFVIDVTHAIGGPTATFQLQDRNADDTDFSDVAGASTTASAAGVVSIDATGLKEILRIKITFDGADAATDGIHRLIQAPTWRPY